MNSFGFICDRCGIDHGREILYSHRYRAWLCSMCFFSALDGRINLVDFWDEGFEEVKNEII